MLKVESTVCFQRKRRRERAVTRERFSLFTVARGLGDSTLARISRAHSFAACKVHWTLHLSGSANRDDFSRIMQLEVVDSHNAPPITCCLVLRLFRFGFDFVFCVDVCL